jgi:hypothetical protein
MTTVRNLIARLTPRLGANCAYCGAALRPGRIVCFRCEGDR